jgi:hypothetical protein
MEELMNMIVADESPAQISDTIKDVLFAKAAERIEAIRPHVASSLFNAEDAEGE